MAERLIYVESKPENDRTNVLWTALLLGNNSCYCRCRQRLLLVKKQKTTQKSVVLVVVHCCIKNNGSVTTPLHILLLFSKLRKRTVFRAL